ncbi:MAG TPA: response regulator transcription factor [Acidobacteriaceae bacterium]|jgi:DNA-binding response OmpR family regulator|nr:response regulator transcription factor [Acidobacteriaceae bacterium]
MPTPLIAVIEDEEHLAQGLLFNLQAEGYRTHHESDGKAALDWLRNTPDPPAAVLLDVMLPGLDGFSIVRSLRHENRFIPVLLLTARGRAEDVVEGFSAGADDYLAKPFDLNILLVRLAALLRRVHWTAPDPVPASSETEDEPQPVYTLGNRTIDLDALEIRSADPGLDSVIHLTVMEADLLRYLLERPNKIIARKELLENVWHVHEDTDTRAIDNFLVRLRRYLEPDPAHPVHFLTVRGVGYRFVP